MAQTKVVILGGGPGGVELAQKLNGVEEISVTLVDRYLLLRRKSSCPGVHGITLLIYMNLYQVNCLCRKSYFEIPWATVRAHVEPSIGERISIPFSVSLMLCPFPSLAEFPV